MRLREIPCPAFGDGTVLNYQPGDCWFARELTHQEACDLANVCIPQMHRVAACRWAFWADHGRALDDSDIAAEHAHRRPLIVVLPNGTPFLTTSPVRAGTTVRDWHRAMAAWVEAGAGRRFEDAWSAVARPEFQRGWAISGEGTHITLSPSIHYNPGGTREWHGFLTDGAFT